MTRSSRKPVPMVTTERDQLVEIETPVNAKDAAEILGVSVNVVYKLAADRRIRHLRYGPRTLRFRPSDLYEFKRSGDGGDGLLDSADAAAVLGITPEMVRQVVAEGDLVAIRTRGGMLRFRREDLVDYMERVEEDPAR